MVSNGLVQSESKCYVEMMSLIAKLDASWHVSWLARVGFCSRQLDLFVVTTTKRERERAKLPEQSTEIRAPRSELPVTNLSPFLTPKSQLIDIMDSIRNCLVRLADLTLCLSILALYAIFFYGLVGHAILTLRTISRAAYRIQEFYCYVILYQSMETLAAEAQASLKSTAPIEDKLKYLTELKQEIKHRSCPERSVPTIFSVVRVALTTPHAFDAGFSILGHLTKRLLLQKLHSSVYSQTLKLLPVFLERLGDQRDRVRLRATAALSDFYAVSDEARKDVELFVRDTVLVSRNPRAKQSAMQWILEVFESTLDRLVLVTNRYSDT